MDVNQCRAETDARDSKICNSLFSRGQDRNCFSVRGLVQCRRACNVGGANAARDAEGIIRMLKHKREEERRNHSDAQHRKGNDRIGVWKHLSPRVYA